ncbi:MAG: sensor histidine kinase [archaeon]|nr:sensor histidine kinase [archaeon]
MWLQNTRHRVFEDDGFVGTVFVVADVTDSKKAEIKSKEKAKKAERIAKIVLKAKDDAVRKNIELDKANQDKSVLLKEVHHRVKNNLQIILSFMRLDERNNKSPQEVVSSSYNRIKTMALIHEKTYQSENVSSVRIAEFIKSDVDSLMYAFGKKDINMENMI